MSPLLKHVKKILISWVGIVVMSSLITSPAFSQQNPANTKNPGISVNRINPSRSSNIRNGRLLGGNDTYPQGSRINANGIISTPRGQRTIPSVRIKHGDGSTSYYYRDGSHITINGTTVPLPGR